MDLLDIDLYAPSTPEETQYHRFQNEFFGTAEMKAELARLDLEGLHEYQFATANTPGLRVN